MFLVTVSTHGAFIAEISRDIDFHIQVSHPLYQAFPYFTVLFNAHIAHGIATFSSNGHATAHQSVPIAISPPVGSLHSLTAV